MNHRSTFRGGLAASITLLASACLFPVKASTSGLTGAGKTVQAFYYNGVLASPEGEIAVGFGDSNPRSLLNPVDYTQGSGDGSTIHVGDLQISIKNLLSGFPFCFANTPGTACADAIDGFDFKFTGENIISVKVDALSSSAFLPVNGVFQGNTHLGLQLISPNEIRVDVTGDLPALNDQLILDVVATPEPSTLLLCGAAGLFLAIRLAFRRRTSICRTSI
jgi:hypothetical protein